MGLYVQPASPERTAAASAFILMIQRRAAVSEKMQTELI